MHAARPGFPDPEAAVPTRTAGDCVPQRAFPGPALPGLSARGFRSPHATLPARKGGSTLEAGKGAPLSSVRPPPVPVLLPAAAGSPTACAGTCVKHSAAAGAIWQPRLTAGLCSWRPYPRAGTDVVIAPTRYLCPGPVKEHTGLAPGTFPVPARCDDEVSRVGAGSRSRHCGGNRCRRAEVASAGFFRASGDSRRRSMANALGEHQGRWRKTEAAGFSPRGKRKPEGGAGESGTYAYHAPPRSGRGLTLPGTGAHRRRSRNPSLSPVR